MASSFLDDLTSILNPLADSDYVVSLLLDEPFESQLSEANAGVSDTQECSLTTTSTTSSVLPQCLQQPATTFTFAGNGNSSYSTTCGPALIESLPSTSPVQLSYTTDNSIDVPNSNSSLLNIQQLEGGAMGLLHDTIATSSGSATTIPGLSIYQQQKKMVQRQQQQPIDIGPTQVFRQQQATVIDSAGTGTLEGGIRVVDIKKMKPQNVETTNNPDGQAVPPRAVLADGKWQQRIGVCPRKIEITLPALKKKFIAEKKPGHILVKTQTGQYQLLRIGPKPVVDSPDTTTAESQVVPPPQNIKNVAEQQQQMPATTNPVVALNQNVKAGFRSQIPVSTTKPGVPTTAAPPVSRKVVSTTANIPTRAASPPANSMTEHQMKAKCKTFLSTLLRLANKQSEPVATNVKMLIQSFVDAKLETEEFTAKLQQELQSSPQPNLIPFLKRSIPYLRHSLATREIHIDGIRPPAHKITPRQKNLTNVNQQQHQMPPNTNPVTVLKQKVDAGNRLQVPDSTTKRGVNATAAPPVSKKVVVTTAGTSTPAELKAATSTSNSKKPQMTPVTPNTAKVKCKNFLFAALRLANKRQGSVATNVNKLTQDLFDAKMEPEDFIMKLRQELDLTFPTPGFIQFFKKSFPYLRHSLATREMYLDGIRPPAFSTVSNRRPTSLQKTV